jgi:hypothetical protein
MALGLRKKIPNYQFYALFFSYSFDIWYSALPYLDTDQVWVWFWSIDFLRSYGPWTEKKSRIISFPDFFSLCLQIFIWYLVHCFAILSCRSRSSLVFYPFEIHEVMAHGLRKALQIVSSLHFGRLALQSQVVRNQTSWTILIEYNTGRGLGIACNTLRMLVSLMWRRHHCRWRAAKFRPMLGTQGLWAGRNIYRATPAVTRDLGFSGLIGSEGPPHLVASYDTRGDVEDLF